MNKLWHGFHAEIQGDLWMTELDPAHSSWKEVINKAYLIEFAHRAHNSVTGHEVNRHDDRGNPSAAKLYNAAPAHHGMTSQHGKQQGKNRQHTFQKRCSDHAPEVKANAATPMGTRHTS